MTERGDGKLKVLVTFPAALFAPVSEALPGVEIVPIPDPENLAPDLEGEVLLIPPWDPGNLEGILARGVRWVHTIGTGVDRFPLELLAGRPLTCSRGASAVPIAEWVFAVMLAHEKKLPDTWISDAEQWQMRELGGLYGSRLGLLGMGGIGCAVARIALAFGMNVTAYRRSTKPSPVEGVAIESDLAALMGNVDHLLVALPLTDDTRHMIGRESLGHIPPGTGIHLVNVARGGLIDQEALREALDDGRVACASLDVADPEPLTPGHWLFEHPQVRLSPHISWSMPGAFGLLLDTFIENLRRYQAGEALGGRVDLESGY